jgi:hypothetical protein
MAGQTHNSTYRAGASARLFTCSLASSRAVVRVGRTPSPLKAAPSRILLIFRTQPRLAASGLESAAAPACKQWWVCGKNLCQGV